MLKIAIVGPESSGKTTLCAELARTYRAPHVLEHARDHLPRLRRPYVEEDLMTIALGQCLLEDAAMRDGAHVLFCDTDMITIRIWSEEVFGQCAPELQALTDLRYYDHWFLCRPDMPWQPDPLRENPHDRDRLFEVYGTMLKKLGKPFSIIEGARAQRIRTAVDIVNALLPAGTTE